MMSETSEPSFDPASHGRSCDPASTSCDPASHGRSRDPASSHIKTEQSSQRKEEHNNTTGYTENLNLHLQAPTLPTDNINTTPQTLANESEFTSQETDCSDYTCSLCGKSCSNKSKLEIHMRYTCKSKMASHRRSLTKTLPCPVCGKLNRWQSDRIAHIRTHTKEKPFSCPQCEKHFYKKPDLEKHVDAVHNKLKPFSCEFCVRTFALKGTLTRHINEVHHKLKPFSCTLCGKSFGAKGHLTTHIDLVHHKLKPFSCAKCNKLFATKQYLTRHMRNPALCTTTTKEKPFSCSLCHKLFSTKSNFNRHTNAFHQKVT